MLMQFLTKIYVMFVLSHRSGTKEPYSNILISHFWFFIPLGKIPTNKKACHTMGEHRSYSAKFEKYVIYENEPINSCLSG